MRASLFALGVALSLQLPGSASAHHMALRFNLEEMAAASETVFYGQCATIEEKEELLGGAMVPVTIYSFTVLETLRGAPSATLKFKALGHAGKKPSGKSDEIIMGGKVWSRAAMLHDMPAYAIGAEYVVFLSAPDSWGLQVPVGRSQGSFSVQAKSDGTKTARNSLDNRSLWSAKYTGFALQKGNSVFPEDVGATTASFVSVPDVERILRRRGPIELEVFLEMTRTVIAGL